MRSIAAVKSSSVDRVGAAARGDQRRLVDQVGEVGAGEARRQRRDLLEVDVGRELRLAACAREDLHAALLVGPVDQHLAVEAAGAQQRRVEDLRPVGRGEQDQPLRGIEAVELGQELVQRLLLLVVAAASGKAPRARPSASSSSMKMMPGPLAAPARTGRARAPRRRRRTSRRTPSR